jgi:hypothetical protein
LVKGEITGGSSVGGFPPDRASEWDSPPEGQKSGSPYTSTACRRLRRLLEGGADSICEKGFTRRKGLRVAFRLDSLPTWRQCPHPMKRVVPGLRPEAVVKGVMVCGSQGNMRKGMAAQTPEWPRVEGRAKGAKSHTRTIGTRLRRGSVKAWNSFQVGRGLQLVVETSAASLRATPINLRIRIRIRIRINCLLTFRIAPIWGLFMTYCIN